MPSVASPNMIDPLKHFIAGAVSGESRHPIPLIATRFDIEIAGGFAAVTTVRTFRNDEAGSIEATMTFPMPVHAVLFALEARVDGRVLTARAQARAAARETYEDAIERGKTSAVHEELLRGVHILSLAHIAPGAIIEVTTRWASTLTTIGDEGHLRIPLTVGDVYGCADLPDSDQLIHGGPVQTANLSLRCTDGRVTLNGTTVDTLETTVSLDAPIDLSVRGAAPRDLQGRAADGRKVTLRVEPRQATTANKLDVAILVDHSGSMEESCWPAGPTKHHAVLKGLHALTERLNDGDVIDLWEFANQAHHIGSTRPPSLPSFFGERRVARRPLSELIGQLGTPLGGTEIGAALAIAMAQSQARDLLLITDGKSHAIDIQALARHGRRVSVILIGEDSLEANVGHLAALTGGDIIVAPNDRIAETLLATINALRDEPAQAKLTQNGASQRLAVGRGNTLITATWTNDDVDEAEQPAFGRAVAAVTASLALPTLETKAAEKLAQAEGLVTHLTSLVLVDEAAETQLGIPATRKIALPSPRTMQASHAFAPMPPPPMASAPMPSSARPGTVGARPGAAMFSRSRSAESAPPPEVLTPVERPIVRILLDLSLVPALIDWNAESNRLFRSDLSGLDSRARDLIEQAARLDVVKDAASQYQLSPILLVVVLLAGAADGNRAALRLQRAILHGQSTRRLDTVAQELGLKAAPRRFLQRLLG